MAIKRQGLARPSQNKAPRNVSSKKQPGKKVENPLPKDAKEIKITLPMRWKDAPFNKVKLLDHLKDTFGSVFDPRQIKDITEKRGSDTVDGIKFFLEPATAQVVNSFIKKGYKLEGLQLSGGYANGVKQGKSQKPVTEVLIAFLEVSYDATTPGGSLNLSNFLARFMEWERSANPSIKIDIDWNHDNFLANLCAAVTSRPEFKNVANLDLGSNPIVSLEWLRAERTPFTSLKRVSIDYTLVYYIPELANLSSGAPDLIELRFIPILTDAIRPSNLDEESLMKLVKMYFPSIQSFNGNPVNVLSAPSPELKRECGNLMKNVHRIVGDRTSQVTMVKKNVESIKHARDYTTGIFNHFGAGSASIYQICRAINPNFTGRILVTNMQNIPSAWGHISQYSSQLLAQGSSFDFKTILSCFLNLEKMTVISSRVKIEPYTGYGNVEAFRISVLGEAWLESKTNLCSFASGCIVIPHDAGQDRISPEFMPVEVVNMNLYISGDAFDILTLVYLNSNLVVRSDLLELYNDPKNKQSVTKIHDIVKEKLSDVKWRVE